MLDCRGPELHILESSCVPNNICFPPLASVLVFPLTCAVQNYAWGKVGLDSEVAKLVLGGDALAVIQDGKPYAEVRGT